MKIQPQHRRKEAGFTLGMIIGLLSLMVLYAASNVLTVHYLHKEMQIIEQRQLMRWEGRTTSAPGKLTARPSTTKPPSAPRHEAQ